MAEKSRDAQYLPALAGLLMLTLGATGWLLYSLSGKPVPGPGPAAVERILYTQAASLEARSALAGRTEAWSRLEEANQGLRGVRTVEFSDDDKALLERARMSVAEVLEAKGDTGALRRIIGRLGELVPGLVDGAKALGENRYVRNQAGASERIAALIATAESIQALAQQLPEGNLRANEKLADKEAELQRMINVLQGGNPEADIAPLKGIDVEQQLASLSRRAAQVGSAVREGLSLSDRLIPALDAAATLEKLAIEADYSVVRAATVPTVNNEAVELQRIYALLAAAAFIALLITVLWWRSTGSRKETARLVQQSEADQQAILQLLDELDSLADGDLTVNATVTESITGAIADSVNYAVEALRDLVTTINESAILLDATTKQTEASARALGSASEAQARQVKAASAAVRQMAASIDEVSGNAERSSDVARHSVDIAHKGGDAVRRTIEGMNTIRETIQETSKRIKRLGESSQEIGDIVELINDIADQTNVLALNASIQASMAGEAGRGFAVVADEVQRLAERSANATKQIEVLVSTIQSDTNEAVVSMERSTTDVVGGALLAENAGAALEEIEQVSNQIAMLVQNISGSSKEQAQFAKAVLQNVEQLQEISSETDRSATDTANYISKLSALASQLREAASGFTLPQESSRSPGKSGSEQPAADNTPRGQAADEKQSTGELAGESAA